MGKQRELYRFAENRHCFIGKYFFHLEFKNTPSVLNHFLLLCPQNLLLQGKKTEQIIGGEPGK